MTTFADSANIIAVSIQDGAMVAGIALILYAISLFKKSGEGAAQGGGQSKVAAASLSLLVGAILVSSGTMVSTMSEIFWSSGSAASYTVSGGGSQLFQNAVLMIKVLGYGLFIRAWLLLVKTGHEGSHQQGYMSKGLLYLGVSLLLIHLNTTQGIIMNIYHSLLPS